MLRVKVLDLWADVVEEGITGLATDEHDGVNIG